KGEVGVAVELDVRRRAHHATARAAHPLLCAITRSEHGITCFCAQSKKFAICEYSVVNALHEPLVTGDVVKQLAQQVAVEHDLPVLAHDRLSPLLGLDLPAGNGIDRARPRAGDVRRRAVGVQRDRDWGGRVYEARHANRCEGMGEEGSTGRGLRMTVSPWRSCKRSSAAVTSSLLPSPPVHSLN